MELAGFVVHQLLSILVKSPSQSYLSPEYIQDRP
jgi:hypothetical protein